MEDIVGCAGVPDLVGGRGSGQHLSSHQVSTVVELDGTSTLSRQYLGNKGFGINLMRRLRLPVPPAFCLTTEVCQRHLHDPQHGLDDVWDEVIAMVRRLEIKTGRTFGDGPYPLLVSVRSGAAVSMPGMLDTVLNLGVTEAVESALSARWGQRFADDVGERFNEGYRRLVLGDPHGEVTDDVERQLRGAVEAVLASWNSDRARAYRRHHGLSEVGGTAVVVQAMVFGNRGSRSGTGVLFTRNPITGAKEPFGEWLAQGQGEDVVSGTSDVEPISALQQRHPNLYDELIRSGTTLEQLHGDPQDIEYTIEDGTLWLLQTRRAKRSAYAALRWALQLYREGVIDADTAVRRVTPAHIEALTSPALQPETRFAAPLLASGLPASPGVASGRAYTDVDEAIDAADAGEPVILVRNSTSPDDIHGMIAARGIVTETGGATSHAAVVSREIGRPTVVGCGAGTAELLEGQMITVDGSEGEVRAGALPVSAWSPESHPELRELSALIEERTAFRAFHDGEHPVMGEVTSETVAAAIEAGNVEVVCSSPLTAMLIAAQLKGQ